jgi:hypothetical protein
MEFTLPELRTLLDALSQAAENCDEDEPVLPSYRALEERIGRAYVNAVDARVDAPLVGSE